MLTPLNLMHSERTLCSAPPRRGWGGHEETFCIYYEILIHFWQMTAD